MESSSAPLPNSRVRVLPLSSKIPSKSLKSPPAHFLFFTVIFILSFSSTASQFQYQNPQIPYSQHCNHIVPEPQFSVAAATTTVSTRTIMFITGYFSGGDPILRATQQSGDYAFRKSLLFNPQYLHETDSKGVYKVEASLTFMIPGLNSLQGNSTHRRLKLVRFRGPKIPIRDGLLRFSLNGFWSESSGKLCMVGSSLRLANSHNSRYPSVVFKVNYRANSSMFNGLVRGSLESADSESYFEPISILAVPRNLNYKYTLIEKEKGSGCSSENDDDGKENLSLIENLRDGVCSKFFTYNDNRLQLESGSDFFDGDVGYRPNFMYFKRIRCSDKQKLLMLLGFPNSSYNGFNFPFDPNTTLIAEAAWNEKKNILCAVACRILNFTESLGNAFVGDCSIKLSLRFPKVLSLRNRSPVVGKIWSNKSVNDAGYFGKIGLWASQEKLVGLPGVRYEYKEIDSARKSCAKMETVKHKRKSYPNGDSIDMTFNMLLRNSKRQISDGFSHPLFVGDKFYGNGLRYLGPVGLQPRATIPVSNNMGSLLNVSYNMRFMPRPDFKFGGGNSSAKLEEISAEGTYNMETGILCMIGCRHLDLKPKLVQNDSLDCEIVVNVQFPPLNAKSSDSIKGIIASTRNKSNPFYFERLEFSSNSISTSQAKASIWRMDLEITMVLITNTLACVFVGLQLFYVKKHPDVLPLISVLMLVVLTLGHMIPLVLNFEALFAANHNRQNVFLESGGWLEVNEVIIRVVTMIAFILQFRLLQLTWSARKGEGSHQNLWVSEKRVVFVSLPLYIGGALIAWFVHQYKNSNQSPFLRPHRMGYQLYHRPLSYRHQQHTLWSDLKSYAGLIEDGFLLPQIIFNLFINSGEKALTPSFYIGTTIVRLLPHAYDLWRAHRSAWSLDLSYIYANHKMDFYSTAWDIIIPCGGLLFAVLIFLQQRWAGRCIIPKKFRENSAYQKISTVSTEEFELKEDAVHQNF